MAEAGDDRSEIDFTGIDDSTARLTHELHEHIKGQYKFELFTRGVEG